MAIKRTILRQNFVTNTAMPESAGLAMAQASREIAGAITSVTNTVDKNQLQTTILEAEKQGKIIGARTHKVYDSSGNSTVVPKPLSAMDLNSLFQPNLYNKNNQAKAKADFEKQAILSYGKAISNDAIDSSASSLLANRGSIDDTGTLSQQRSANSYIASLKSSLDPKVFAEISPTLNRIWSGSVRQASAILIDNNRKLNVKTALKSIDYLTKYEINHRSGGMNGNEIDQDEETLSWIAKQKEEAFLLLKENATDMGAYQTVIDAAKENLETGIVVNSVTAGKAVGMSYSELATMVSSSAKAFELTPEVSGANILQAGMAEITKLSKIDNLQKAESHNKSLGKVYEMLINLHTNNVVPTEKEISELSNPHKYQIGVQLRAWDKTEDNLRTKNYNDKIGKEILELTFGRDINSIINMDKSDHAVSTASLRRKEVEIKMADLLLETKNTDLSIRNINSIYTLEVLETNKLITNNNAEMDATFQLMFSGVSPNASHPNTLRSTAFTNALEAKNFIGNNPKINKYTLKAWYKKIDAYEIKFNKTQKHAKNLNDAADSIEFGVLLTSDQKISLEKEVSNTVSVLNKEGKEVTVDTNVLSKDPIVRNASQKSVVAFAHTTGYLSEHAKNILNSAPTLKHGKDDQGFYYIKELYFTLKDLYQKSGGTDWADGWKTFVTNNDLDASMLDGMQLYEDASEFNKNHQPGVGNRAISNFFNVAEGTTDRDLIKEVIADNATYIDNNFASDLLHPYLKGRPELKANLKKWYSDNNIKHLNDMVIKDPVILNGIIKSVQGKVRTGKLDQSNKTKALSGAVYEAINKFSSMISAEVDADGNAHLILGNNLLTEGQMTIPKDAYELKQEDIILDFKDKYYLAGANIQTQDLGVKDAIKNDRLMFLPNNEVTGPKTFKVVAHTEDGRFVDVINHYRYEWDDSRDNKFYYEAMEKIPNSTVRNLLASVKFFPKNNRDAVIESLKNGSDWADGWRSIVAGYNQLAIDVKYVQTIPSEILPIVENPATKKELMEWFDTIGWRLFRFDLR